MGDKGETRPREGGHNIQHRHTCGETMGDKRRQGPLKADMIQGGDTIQHRHQCGETMGDNGETRPRKADTPSSTGTHVGDNGKQWHTTGDKGKPGDKKGDNGRQLGGQ